MILPLVSVCAGLAVAQSFTQEQTPATRHKQVKVSNKTLDRYVGRFTMQGLIIKVTRENDHIFIQKNDGPRTEVFPEAEFQFFTKTNDDVFSFEGVTGGKAIILKLVTEGRTTPLYRVE